MPTSVPLRRSRRGMRAAAVLTGAAALATIAAYPPDRPEPSATPSRAMTVLSESPAPAATTPTSPPLSEQVRVASGAEATVEAAAATEPTPAPEPEPEPEPALRSVWDRLADCESGDWLADGGHVEASANWSASAGLFEGGLQFHPDTWDAFRDPDMPGNAYDATREQQIAVAERVLASQGWEAWPVCSRKLGLR